MDDWLNEKSEAEADNVAEGKRLLGLYSVFETDPRAKELLKLWTDGIESQDVPPDSSLAKYAYYEARRAFVRGIHRQVKLAREMHLA